MNKILIIVFILLFFVSPLKCFAVNSSDVVINEIAWMGTKTNYQDEWIELYNNTSSSITLDGWQFKAADDTPKIILKGTILVNGFYLLERTDDNTLPGITADQIYGGSLENGGENLELYDSAGNLIDTVNCGSGWFAGDNKTKQTMERKNSKTSGSDSLNWQSSQNLGGTPKAKNSTGVETLPSPPKKDETTENLKATESLSKSLPETSQNIYPSGIVINEILPSPEGPDEKDEWIEIFNQNSFEIDLSGWKIKDASGKITTYTFPEETKISPQGFLVLPRGKTKITLNNDGDGVSLTSPAENIIDKVNYEKAPQGKSYNRVNSDWFWSADLTPGATNIAEKTGARSSEDKLASEAGEKRELAAIGEQVAKPSRSLFLLLIALGTAIFSGIIILILKKKIKEERSL